MAESRCIVKKMKIYFTASIHGKEKFDKNYDKIVEVLSKFGHKVIADHILQVSLKNLPHQRDEDRISYYRKMIRWITTCDLVVAELSYSSASVGHEVSVALEKGKPVIALYFKGKGPHLLTGVGSDKLLIVDYETENLDSVLKDAINDAKDQMDVRFNFFISPKIGVYLDWIAKNKKIPRAVYLRRLIDEDIRKNKDFKGK